MNAGFYFNWKNRQYVERYNQVYAWDKKAILAYLFPLDLKKSDFFADFGCGNGEVLAAAALLVAKAIGIDPSRPQIEKAKKNTRVFPNVDVMESDFLNYPFDSIPITKAASRKALHHLPDLQKEAFIKKLGKHLPANGLFLLEDGMTAFEKKDLPRCWNKILKTEAPAYYGQRWESIRPDFIKSFKEEFLTSRSVLFGMLERAGFEIADCTTHSSFYGTILARKKTTC